MEHIVTEVSKKEDIIPTQTMLVFLSMVEQYVKARIRLEDQIRAGKTRWFLANALQKEHISFAKVAWRHGMDVSTQAHGEYQKCLVEHKDAPRNEHGKCSVCFPNADLDWRQRYPLTWKVVLEAAEKISSQGNVAPIPANIASSSGGTPTTAQAIVPDAGIDDYVPGLADMPLDPDDSRIFVGLVQDRLRRLSCDSSTRGWESLALLRDYARSGRDANESTSD